MFNYFKFGPLVQEKVSFKDCLIILAVVAIWFGIAEPFLQFWKRHA